MAWGDIDLLSDSEYDSNGARIYFTGENDQGERIRYSGGPRFGGMMSGRVSCASCHGSDGRGGEHWMHMQRMEAPDIRWSSLTGDEHTEAGGHGDHAEYDQDSFKAAVREGIDPGGDPLSRDMPRWRMSDADLHDLMDFLQSLEGEER